MTFTDQQIMETMGDNVSPDVKKATIPLVRITGFCVENLKMSSEEISAVGDGLEVSNLEEVIEKLLNFTEFFLEIGMTPDQIKAVMRGQI